MLKVIVNWTGFSINKVGGSKEIENKKELAALFDLFQFSTSVVEHAGVLQMLASFGKSWVVISLGYVSLSVQFFNNFINRFIKQS